MTTSPGRLPTFLIIGAMKSGSTTLYNHLRQHPEVMLPDYKEPEFFVEEKNWSRGVDWYRSLFIGAGEVTAVGEASTSYTKFTEFGGVPARIASVLPDVQLVYVLREPISRMRSMYQHQVLTRSESRPINEALLKDDRYLGPSLYAENARRYLDYFPRDRLHFLLTDDLQKDPSAAVRGVTEFLGLPDTPDFVPTERVDLRTSDRRADRRIKSRVRGLAAVEVGFRRAPSSVQNLLRRVATRPSTASGPTELDPATVEVLLEKVRPDLENLTRMLGPQFDAWGLLDLP
ncbi:MAG: sulfotransferase domain-containing protein [Actinomycetia bacterium]|nr:sulfotransferase domain-containing protein [Actinomycetes bacterium]